MFQCSFHWHTATPTSLHTVAVWCYSSRSCDSLCMSAKARILTIWPFIEKVGQPPCLCHLPALTRKRKKMCHQLATRCQHFTTVDSARALLRNRPGAPPSPAGACTEGRGLVWESSGLVQIGRISGCAISLFGV